MEKLNYEQILEKLKTYYASDVSEFAYLRKDDGSLGLGQIKEVDSYGGEGQGERWWSVKHFTDHDVYIRVDGYYSSYEGVTFDGWKDSCSQVLPKERKIVVYE